MGGVIQRGSFFPLYQRGIEGDFFIDGRKSPLSPLWQRGECFITLDVYIFMKFCTSPFYRTFTHVPSTIMAEKVLMLALSPTMETGTIAKWNVKEGDTVGSGDVLCEVETDKAVMDYESMTEGVLLKIVLPEGGEAQIGDMIAIIGEAGEDVSSLLTEAASGAQSAESVEPPEAPDEESVKSVISTEQTEEAPTAPAVEPTSTKIRSSPLARKLAQEAGLELSHIKGSGPGGRIIQRDIERALQESKALPVAQSSAVTPSTVSTVPALSDEVIRVSKKRKIIAQRLTESKYSAPHYYLKVVVSMDEVMQARKALNSQLREKVSLNAFLIKFVAEAIRRHPMMNSTWNGDNIIKHGSVDIGLAVAQPDGLITPVVRNCTNKGIREIDQELSVLIQKAQNNRLEPEEYSGATFTVSSLGSFGIREFTAIINPPASAILAIGEIHKEPVVGDNEQIEIRSNMIMTLSCDHRVIDGSVGAGFLKELKEMLEHPIRALY